jgi:hypothetical protein
MRFRGPQALADNLIRGRWLFYGLFGVVRWERQGNGRETTGAVDWVPGWGRATDFSDPRPAMHGRILSRKAKSWQHASVQRKSNRVSQLTAPSRFCSPRSRFAISCRMSSLSRASCNANRSAWDESKLSSI